MNRPKITSVTPVGSYRLRLVYTDGFAGDVDFAETVAKGGVFAFMQDQIRFRTVSVAQEGSALVWIDDSGDDVDFCADALRMKAEANAVAHVAAE